MLALSLLLFYGNDMPKVYVKGEGLEAKAKVSFDLNRLEITIGRTDDNDLVITDDSSISSKHCAIKRVFGGYVIKDLNSSNGIFKDGEKEEKFLMENGLEFNVGDSELVFAYKKGELEGLLKEEQNPRTYAKESDLLDLENQRKGISSDSKSSKKDKKKSSQIESSESSAKSYTPRQTYTSRSSGNSAFGFLGIILSLLIGLGGGFYIKHHQTYGTNIIDDFKTNKIKPIWEK